MRTAIYARQSVEKKDSLSIESQIKRCTDICDMNGWSYKVYPDAGYSGSNIKRPQFQQMLTDIQDGKISRVIAYRMDRISRSLSDFSQLVQMFNRHQVDFMSATEQFDTSTPVGRAMVYIILTFAQLERETIAERIRDNWWHRVKSGRYWGGGLPAGYRTEPGVINGHPGSIAVPDGKDSEIVRDIFHRYLDGQSFRKIAHDLNAIGIKTTKGKEWVASSVRQVIIQPFYGAATPDAYRWFDAKGVNIYDDPSAFDGKHGMVLLGEEGGKHKPAADWSSRLLLVGQHEPLVDGATWISAQTRSVFKAKWKRQGVSKITWLTSVARCAECGSNFIPRAHTKKGKQYLYLTCSTYNTCGKTVCSHGRHHHIDLIEPQVEEAIFRHIDGINLQETASIDAATEDTPEVNEIEIRVLEIDTKISRLIEQLTEAGAAGKYITKRIEELDAERSEISKQLAESVEHNAAQKTNKRVADVIGTIRDQWKVSDTTQKSHLAGLVIHRLKIDRSGELQIEWLF